MNAVDVVVISLVLHIDAVSVGPVSLLWHSLGSDYDANSTFFVTGSLRLPAFAGCYKVLKFVLKIVSGARTLQQYRHRRKDTKCLYNILILNGKFYLDSWQYSRLAVRDVVTVLDLNLPEVQRE